MSTINSSAEIRLLEAEDAYAHRVLKNEAFGQGRVVSPEEATKEWSGGNHWGVFEAGKLKAALTALPFAVHWGPETVLKMGGIAGVATHADARGRGYVDGLLKTSLEAMRGRGETISALYPFAWAFYRRHGWDWVGEKHEVTLPLTEIRSNPEGRRVRPVDGDEATVRAALEPIHTAHAKRYRGVFTSETHRWDRALRHDDNRTTSAYIHETNGLADGYMLWRFNSNGETGHLRAFAANSDAACRGFLSLLHYFGTQCHKADVILPTDSTLRAHLMHWDMKMKLGAVFMGRVVDVAGAFAQLQLNPNVRGMVTFALHDEQALWNNGVWRITAEGGAVQCASVMGATDAPIHLDIQALSQAFWGLPSLHSLRDANRVTVSDEPSFALLAQILPPANVYTMDDF